MSYFTVSMATRGALNECRDRHLGRYCKWDASQRLEGHEAPMPVLLLSFYDLLVLVGAWRLSFTLVRETPIALGVPLLVRAIPLVRRYRRRTRVFSRNRKSLPVPRNLQSCGYRKTRLD